MWFGRGSQFVRTQKSGVLLLEEVARHANRLLCLVTSVSRLHHAVPLSGWTVPSVSEHVSSDADRRYHRTIDDARQVGRAIASLIVARTRETCMELIQPVAWNAAAEVAFKQRRKLPFLDFTRPSSLVLRRRVVRAPPSGTTAINISS